MCDDLGIQWDQKDCRRKMKLSAGIFCFVLAILLSVNLKFASGSFASQQDQSRRSGYVILGKNANETKVYLLRSQTLLIILPAQFGTGYSWKVIHSGVPLGTVEKLDATETQKLTKEGILDVSDQKSLPGGSENQVFRLKPSADGESQIELQYVRRWDHEKPQGRFVVTLNVGAAPNPGD